MDADAVARLIGSHRYHFGDEAALQAGIEKVLTAAGVVFEREYALKPSSGRIEFWIPEGGIGIEAKTKSGGNPAAVLRQLIRYADHPDIQALIVVSTRLRPNGLPATLRGKPVRLVSLWANGI